MMIKSRRMRWAGHVAYMGEIRGAFGVLVGRSERKRQLGKPSIGLKGNIKMNLDVLRGGTVWIDLAQVR
jgi:hypothetical protein